jgi:hypothetical protein
MQSKVQTSATETVDDMLFQQFLTHVFDHPGEGPEWYLEPQDSAWAGPADTALCIARTFERSGEC